MENDAGERENNSAEVDRLIYEPPTEQTGRPKRPDHLRGRGKSKREIGKIWDAGKEDR